MANKPVAEQALKLVQEGRLEDAEHLIDSMILYLFIVLLLSISLR